MSRPDCGFDKQLAADLKSQVLQHLKDSLSAELQQECESRELVIKEAWKTIQKQMASLEARREVILATLRYTEGEERAQDVIRSGVLDKVVPPTYKAMVEMIRSGENPKEYPTPLTSPGTTLVANLKPRTPTPTPKAGVTKAGVTKAGASNAGAPNAKPADLVLHSPTPAPAAERRPAVLPKSPESPKAHFVSRISPHPRI